jgi:hypothetical protein
MPLSSKQSKMHTFDNSMALSNVHWEGARKDQLHAFWKMAFEDTSVEIIT